MKFFNNIQIKILRSNYQLESWAYPCDVQDTLEPSHRSNYLYSTHHNQQPKNVVPSSVSATQEILVASGANYDLSSASPNYSHPKMEDTQYADERDPCSQRLSVFSHSLNCKPELANLDNEPVYPLPAHDSGILLSKPNVRSDGLHYVNYDDIQPQCKDTKNL